MTADLDDSPEAREAFFVMISVTKGRPMGLGSAALRSSTSVGAKMPTPPHQTIPQGHLNAAASIADFGWRAGLSRIALPEGKVEVLYRMYLEWYERAEAHATQRR